MTKPNEAVKAAIHDLSLKDGRYTLEDVVDLAEKKLGKDADFYRKYFLRSNLSRKASDALRHHHENTTLSKKQLDLLGGIPERMVAIRQDEGESIYMLFAELKWRHLEALRNEQTAKSEKRSRNSLLAAIRKLEPIMTKDQSLTVQDAAKQLPDTPDNR